MSILFGVLYSIITMVVALVLTFGVVVAHNYIVANKEKVVKAVKFVLVAVAMVAVLLLAMAIIPPIARAEWCKATIVNSVPAVYEDEKCYLVTVNINGEKKSYYDSENLSEGTIIEVDYINGKIENSREPEPIWFPPIFLLGSVAPIVYPKKQSKTRKKTYPPCFWGTHSKSDKHAYIYHFGKMGVEEITSNTMPLGYVKYDESEEAKKTVCQEVARGHKLGKPCIAWVYNPVTQQSEVITFAEIGVFERFAKFSEKVKTNIATTREEVFPEGFSRVFEEETCKEPEVNIIRVIYNKNGKEYKFYPIAEHKVGDFCCVEKVNEYGDITYKNVKVVFVGKETKSSIKTFCKSKHIEDLSKEYCRYAVDRPECWADWGGSDPRQVGILVRKPANGVLTDAEMAEAQHRINAMIYCDQDTINESEEPEQAE